MAKHKHKWISPVEIVGGCKENPGTWSIGTKFIYYYVCRICGAEKKETFETVSGKATRIVGDPSESVVERLVELGWK